MNIHTQFKPEDYKLCYVDGNKAYFTTRPLDKQWGDDWNDAPYEHNAGRPYTWRDNDKEEMYDVVGFYFDADLIQPSEGCFNSSFSVEQINRGAVAWLRSPSLSPDKCIIHAGTNIPDFIKKIQEAKGKVLVPIQWMI